jgi:hypothetical protein
VCQELENRLGPLGDFSVGLDELKGGLELLAGDFREPSFSVLKRDVLDPIPCQTPPALYLTLAEAALPIVEDKGPFSG